MKTIILFGTDNCHLCDEAKDLVADVVHGVQDDYSLLSTDVSTSEQLMERYGAYIPVVRIAETGDELGWPFDKQRFTHFLTITNPETLEKFK